MRFVSAMVLASLVSWTAFGQTFTISTFAGGGLPVNIPGPTAGLLEVAGVAADPYGNIFFACPVLNAVLRLDAVSGIVTVAAGTGVAGFSGDNGPATSAQLRSPFAVAVDSAGNLYIGDYGNFRVREISNGVITTIAGNGMFVDSGEDGPATSAGISPAGVAVDSAGNLYIADDGNRIRKITNGVITTIAGNGTYGFSGDNGPATSAQLNGPEGVAVDAAGNVYIAESRNNRVRMVSNGIITTLAGNGTSGFSGDNGPATGAQLLAPWSVAVDAAGILYIGDNGNRCVRKVTNGVITTVAGDGTYGLGGDNGPAVSAQLRGVWGVTVDFAGNLYIGDFGNGLLRRVSNGTITTVAGGGLFDFSGDNGAAASAQLHQPVAVAVDSAGNVYIDDYDNNRIRKVSTDGIITTVAGNGTRGFSGDNGPAPDAQLSSPFSLAVDPAGNLYIGDQSRVRMVSNGVITTVAGGGTSRDDNIPAGDAQFAPLGLAADAASNLYIADGSRVRIVSNGVITTVAGGGSSPDDNVPATSAQLSPIGVAVDQPGNLYIAESGGRVRMVSNGVITTLAGNGTPGFSGDNGPALDAQLELSGGITVDATGNVYITEVKIENYFTIGSRVREVSNGVITTVAGTGNSGFNGDDGPAASGELNVPRGLAVNSAGNIYVADQENNRIRVLTPQASSMVR